MTVNLSQPQYQQQDLHIKRKASESLESDSRLSKRFNRLEIHPGNDKTLFPVSPNGAASTTIQSPPHHPQPSQTALTPSSKRTALSPHRHDPSTAIISTSTPERSFTASPEAMQIESNSPVSSDGSPTSKPPNSHIYDNNNSNSNSTSTSNNERVILLPTVDKQITKIPAHLLRRERSKTLLPTPTPPTSAAPAPTPVDNPTYLPPTTLSPNPNPNTNTNNNNNTNTDLVLYADPTSLSVPRERDSVRKVILEARARARMGVEGVGGELVSSPSPSSFPSSVSPSFSSGAAPARIGGAGAGTSAGAGADGGGGGVGAGTGSVFAAHRMSPLHRPRMVTHRRSSMIAMERPPSDEVGGGGVVDDMMDGGGGGGGGMDTDMGAGTSADRDMDMQTSTGFPGATHANIAYGNSNGNSISNGIDATNTQPMSSFGGGGGGGGHGGMASDADAMDID